MKEGCCLFSKTKIDIDKLIEEVGFKANEVVVINDVNGWLKKDKENIVIEYRGMLDEDDHEKYAGYYYYDVMAEKKEDIEKLIKLNDANIIVE